MNYRTIAHTVGVILQFEALFLLPSLIISLIYGETRSVYAFIISAVVSLLIGILLTYVVGKNDKMIYAREGFAIVAIAWMAISAVGALPYVISGELPNYIDAFFETVSGFTTTAASVVTDVEALSKGIMFWRSFTHWLGGMGVLVFLMAIFPQESGRSIHIMRAEMPGPTVGKLVPKLRETARILYIIYIGITVLETLILWAMGMTFYDALLHAFGTSGTSGFAIKSDSLAGYSTSIQWVITVFMLMGGVNFNLYYLVFARQFRSVFKSVELWVYLAIVTVSTLLVAVNVSPLYEGIEETARQAFFHVSSVITTTGYSICNYDTWPDFSKTLLMLLMFIGGCAGSTAGGIKVPRFILACKSIVRDIKQMLHPAAVSGIRYEGKKVDDKTIHGVNAYFTFYFIIFFVALLLISAEPFGFETNFSAVSACFNNIGAGFGAVGPYGSYAAYSSFAKIVLSALMLLGRLEIFPLLLVFTPIFWKAK